MNNSIYSGQISNAGNYYTSPYSNFTPNLANTDFTPTNNQDIFTLNNNENNVTEKNSGKNKAGVFAAVGLVAAAGIATFAAFKTGKTNSKEGAKLGEILKNGFSEIGRRISKNVGKIFKSEAANGAETAAKTVETAQTAAKAAEVLSSTKKLTKNEEIAHSAFEEIKKLINNGDEKGAKKLYRQFMKQWHPDMHSGKPTEAQAQEIVATLSSLMPKGFFR